MKIPWMLVSMAGLVLTSPAPAEACSCAAGVVVWSLPTGSATNVPLNPVVRLAYSYDEPAALSLLSSAGSSIPVTAEQMKFGNYTLITLRLEAGTHLEPNSRYRVQDERQDVLVFTTGSEADSVAPTLQGISSLEGGYDDGCSDGMCSSCGESVAMKVGYDHPADNLTASPDLLYRVHLSTTGTPDASSPFVIIPGWLTLGYSLCSTTFPELSEGDIVTIRAAAIDAAGLESELSAPVSAEVAADPDSVGCGRRAGEGRSSAWLGLLLIWPAGYMGWRSRAHVQHNS